MYNYWKNSKCGGPASFMGFKKNLPSSDTRNPNANYPYDYYYEYSTFMAYFGGAAPCKCLLYSLFGHTIDTNLKYTEQTEEKIVLTHDFNTDGIYEPCFLEDAGDWTVYSGNFEIKQHRQLGEPIQYSFQDSCGPAVGGLHNSFGGLHRKGYPYAWMSWRGKSEAPTNLYITGAGGGNIAIFNWDYPYIEAQHTPVSGGYYLSGTVYSGISGPPVVEESDGEFYASIFFSSSINDTFRVVVNFIDEDNYIAIDFEYICYEDCADLYPSYPDDYTDDPDIVLDKRVTDFGGAVALLIERTSGTETILDASFLGWRATQKGIDYPEFVRRSTREIQGRGKF